MENIRSIEPIDATRSRWTVKALGNEVSWESVITKDVPGEKLHDEQDVYTKMVLKPGQAGRRLAA